MEVEWEDTGLKRVKQGSEGWRKVGRAGMQARTYSLIAYYKEKPHRNLINYKVTKSFHQHSKTIRTEVLVYMDYIAPISQRFLNINPRSMYVISPYKLSAIELQN